MARPVLNYAKLANARKLVAQQFADERAERDRHEAL